MRAQGCYRNAPVAAKQSRFHTLRVHVTQDATGKVVKAADCSNPGNAIDQCICALLFTMAFPPPNTAEMEWDTSFYFEAKN